MMNGELPAAVESAAVDPPDFGAAKPPDHGSRPRPTRSTESGAPKTEAEEKEWKILF